jgi:hypothetical protein
MDSAARGGMRTRMPAAAGLFLAWATAASAQTWQQAYDRQDYAAAAPLLQAEVFEHSSRSASRYPDVRAIQALARMYSEGRGVPVDAFTACALSNLGSGAAVYQHGERDARTIAIQREVEAYCIPLTASERREAMEPDRCLSPGPEARVLYISGTRRLEVGRSRLTVVERGRERHFPLMPLLRCAQQVADVRHVRVAAPKGSGQAAREFVQFYSWNSGVTDGRRVRSLEWSAIELTKEGPVLRTRTVLEQAEGSAWPARGVPAEFSRGVVFSMHRSGDVRWQMAGRRALHGIIGRPAPLRAASALR